MQELISPAQSESFVLFASILVALASAIAGYRVLGARGIIAGSVGILVFALWQAHKYVTRYDATSGYFGLDKVAVLLGEVVGFVLLGVVLGWLWNQIRRTSGDTYKEE